ncbi:hypothetical protein D0U04_27010 [Bacillus clarus]|uniref:Uncharacterized protein n=1 Tax=Bacillus clarus TaxID=2338372 RepID=A0A090ZET5_9BACI|nr:hypothetical protein DJ93_5220 [Bacillus clarus]RFT62909.1 hypothetical protein D0U04_27010 [Bacillus clarus]
MKYEYMVESVEGPAWYVEMNAYNKVCKNENKETLRKYSSLILDTYDSNSNIRRSCYKSGMILCLLLDEIFPEWKTSFLESDELLYDFFKRNIEFDIGLRQMKEIKISTETKEIINFVNRNKEKEFKMFHNKKGYHLRIIGDIELNMLNPMNLILNGNKVLHKTFLGVNLRNKTYMINHPVISTYKEEIKNIKQIYFVINEKPIKTDEGWSILGVGEIEGEYEEKGNAIFLFV